MIIFLDRKRRRPGRRRAGAVSLAWLLACLIASAGCSAAVPYLMQAELPYRKSTLRSMGLLPPTIEVHEALGARAEVVRDHEWSREARENIFGTIIAEMPVNDQQLVLITDDGGDLSDMADLFSAVDYSIQRHAFSRTGGSDPDEPLAGSARSIDYSLGPAKETMERHRVDAVWLVTGLTVLVPTGAQGASLPDAAGSGPAQAPVPKRCELRAALVDMNGAVLFYAMVNEGNLLQVERDNAGAVTAQKNGADALRRQEQGPEKNDLRDPDTARRYVRALFSQYRKAVAQ